MATLARQPFAPLDGTRLQNLTSIKNRQNASAPTVGKRKAAESVEIDDSENVDPAQFAKRSKGSGGFSPAKDLFKPSSFGLTKANSAPSIICTKPAAPRPAPATTTTPISNKQPALPRPRTLLNPKSPAAKLNAGIAKSSPLSAPAGRSPTRGSKRVGILSNRRRTASPFTRVDPPAFNIAAAPFSLDAALKGTIPSYASRSLASSSSSSSAALLSRDSDVKSSWFFDIHEDTPEQEMTNLLQHSTCTLDISSDEESERRAKREYAEGRDKENIPPVDDVSQTSRATRGPRLDEMICEKARDPLASLKVEDFYAAGCDASSVIIVPGDEEETSSTEVSGLAEQKPLPALVAAEKEAKITVEEIMCQTAESVKAALLDPVEGTGESFELWESGSAKDDAEPVSVPSPQQP